MAVDLLAAFDNAPARKLLIGLSRKGQHPDVRRAALLGLLRYLQAKRADPSLVRMLFATLGEQPFQPVASTALDLLYRMTLGREYQRECLALVGSPHFPVRKFALRTLATMETAPATQAILNALGSRDPALREVALECLQKLKSARQLLLEGFLRAKDPAAAGTLAAALEAHRDHIRPESRRRIVKRAWDLWIKRDPLAEPTLSSRGAWTRSGFTRKRSAGHRGFGGRRNTTGSPSACASLRARATRTTICASSWPAPS
jgi:HEAT repeat protein